jgi:hypothetical protein
VVRAIVADCDRLSEDSFGKKHGSTFDEKVR